MAQTEVEAEIEKIKVLEERIKAPSIWSQLSCGIRFEDLQDTRYDEAAQLLKEHYITEEVTYRSVNIIQDKEGTEEFINNARIWMKDKMSIAAVNEKTDELAGILIMKMQEKCLVKEMLKSAVELAASVNVPAISGIFLAHRVQELAVELGFKKYNEILYKSYVRNGPVKFTPTDANCSAAFMAIRIPYIQEIVEIQQQQASHFTMNNVIE